MLFWHCLYIIDYAMDVIIKEFYRQNPAYSNDIFERLVQRSIIKLKVANKYPEISKIVVEAYVIMPDDLKEELAARYKKMEKEHLPFAFKDIDTSKFRVGLDLAKAFEFIYLTLEALSNKFIAEYNNGNRI